MFYLAIKHLENILYVQKQSKNMLIHYNRAKTYFSYILATIEDISKKYPLVSHVTCHCETFTYTVGWYNAKLKN